MDVEKWEEISGYEGLYQISSFGNAKSLDRIIKTKQGYVCRKGRNIKPALNSCGYLCITLCKNGTRKTVFIQRLVAETFIANPENKKEVNHLNGNKLDNRIDNLEWCTHSENVKHAYSLRLFKVPPQRCRRVFDPCTNRSYNSIKEAAKENGMSYSTCKNMLNGWNKNTTCLQFAE